MQLADYYSSEKSVEYFPDYLSHVASAFAFGLAVAVAAVRSFE